MKGEEPFRVAEQLYRELKSWLFEAALPLWWAHGADHIHGGFHESLRLDGEASGANCRARLNPRQMWVFHLARQLGWSGPAAQAIRHGLEFFLAHYRREDGLYRALVAADGTPLDDTAMLYDQAFALLGFAAAYGTLGEERARDLALELHGRLVQWLSHPIAGFEERHPRSLPLSSNSHMHLLEAALAWDELDGESRWRELADRIVDLALTRFADSRYGFFREFFAADWGVWPNVTGTRVEPGHQFEWAWLLWRWSRCRGDDRSDAAALRLIRLGEEYGVDPKRGVVVNALLTDGTVLDPEARLWPQTERLKAACAAAVRTGEMRYWDKAVGAARVLQGYLATPLRGLWRDQMNADGAFIEQPAPASSFYHIASAVAELEGALARWDPGARLVEFR